MEDAGDQRRYIDDQADHLETKAKSDSVGEFAHYTSHRPGSANSISGAR
jgi:hypothetical protein